MASKVNAHVGFVVVQQGGRFHPSGLAQSLRTVSEFELEQEKTV